MKEKPPSGVHPLATREIDQQDPEYKLDRIFSSLTAVHMAILNKADTLNAAERTKFINDISTELKAFRAKMIEAAGEGYTEFFQRMKWE